MSVSSRPSRRGQSCRLGLIPKEIGQSRNSCTSSPRVRIESGEVEKRCGTCCNCNGAQTHHASSRRQKCLGPSNLAPYARRPPFPSCSIHLLQELTPMMARRSIFLRVLASTILLSSAAASGGSSAQQCYYRDGSLDNNHTRSANTPNAMCCNLETETLLPNGLCQDNNRDSLVIWRRSCSDKNWSGDHCQTLCTEGVSTHD